MVNTTIATDRRLASLSLTAEYLYLKTIPHLDRDGLILGDSSLLWPKSHRCGLKNCFSIGTEQEWLALELVIAYDTADRRVCSFQVSPRIKSGAI